MKLNNLYTKTQEALEFFKKNETGLDLFQSITEEIYDLIKFNNITYKDLSNEGKICQHLVNVAILSGKLGIFYNVENLYNLVLGSLLHDLGKLYINQSILNKKGKLNNIEKLIIAEHTTIGYEKVKHLIDDKIIADIILNHHIVFKNISYNTDIKNIKDKEKYSLICGISDITDAVLSYRPYKKPLLKENIFIDLDEKGIINYQDQLCFLLKGIM